MQYSDWRTRVTTFLEIDLTTDLDWPNIEASIIEDAELRCYRDCDFLVTRESATGTLTSGANSLAIPADMVIARSLGIYTPVGGTAYLALERRGESYLLDYAPDATVLGQPKYWGEVASASQSIASSIMIAPTPNGAFAYKLDYTYRPAALSASNPTTWLSTWCPDLMTYASLVAACGYIKNFGAQSDNPQMALSWEKQYQTALTQAIQDERRRKSDGVFDVSNTPAPALNTPKV